MSKSEMERVYEAVEAVLSSPDWTDEEIDHIDDFLDLCEELGISEYEAYVIHRRVSRIKTEGWWLSK